MAESHTGAYLSDHLAGSEVALEMLAQLETAHEGDPMAPLAAELRSDIVADRLELEALITRLPVAANRWRQVAAWLAEKAARIKLSWDDSPGGPLRLLEVLDALSLGIEGKRLLWRALRAAAECSVAFQGLDYDRLERRAEQQRSRVETLRIEAAKVVLTNNSSVSQACGVGTVVGH